MNIDLSKEAVEFLKKLLANLTINPAQKDAEQVVGLVREVLVSLEEKEIIAELED